MFQLTISASTPEELLANLISAVSSMQSGSYAIAAAEVYKGEDKSTKEPGTGDKAEPSGGRSSRRGAENKPGEDSAAETAGRRGRGAAKENPVNDDEEQAALRAQLVTDLQVLADNESAHKAVSDALARVGAKNVHEIASASLGDFNEDIQPLLAETDEPAGDDAEVRAKVITDLVDLQDVIDNPEKEGEDVDVTETLKAAWKNAGAPVRGSVTDGKKLDKVSAKALPDFAAEVSKLIAKYF